MDNTQAQTAPDPTMSLDDVTDRMYRAIRSTRPEHWLDRGGAPEITDKGLSTVRSVFAVQEVSGTRHRSHEDLGDDRIYHSEAAYRLPGRDPHTFQGSAALSSVKLPGGPGDKAAAARQQADTRCLKAATRELLALKAVTWEDLSHCGIQRRDVPKSQSAGRGGDSAPSNGAGGETGGWAAPTGLERGQGESAKDHCWRVYKHFADAKNWDPWNEVSNAVLPKGIRLKDATPEQINQISANIQARFAKPGLPGTNAGASPGGAASASAPAPMTEAQRERLSKLCDALGLDGPGKQMLMRSCGWTSGPLTEGIADDCIQALRAELEAKGVNPDTGEIVTPAQAPWGV